MTFIQLQQLKAAQREQERILKLLREALDMSEDELRAALVLDGRCWGYLELLRERGERAFSRLPDQGRQAARRRDRVLGKSFDCRLAHRFERGSGHFVHPEKSSRVLQPSVAQDNNVWMVPDGG